MPSIKDILKHTKGLKPIVTTTDQFLTLKKNWASIFGKLAPEFKLEFIRDKKMIVSTSNYVWATEIEGLKDVIIKKAAQFLSNKKAIKDIKVVTTKYETKKVKRSMKLNSDDFFNKIKEEHERKLNLGYTMCSRCQSILTPHDICIGCQSLP